MNLLATLRKEVGLSQRQLAEALKVSPAAIALYETGKRTPPLPKAKIIADYFNRQIEDVFLSTCSHNESENGGQA